MFHYFLVFHLHSKVKQNYNKCRTRPIRKNLMTRMQIQIRIYRNKMLGNHFLFYNQIDCVWLNLYLYLCRSNATPIKKLPVPAEFFACVGEVTGKNASLYRCLHPNCVPKKKRDGSEKPLVVYHSSRYNAKRHFLVGVVFS